MHKAAAMIMENEPCVSKYLIRPKVLQYMFGFNTLRPRQNGRRFADDTFKHIFLNQNVWISLKISLKFVPKFQINNIPANGLARPVDKPLSEPIYASLGLNELSI